MALFIYSSFVAPLFSKVSDISYNTPMPHALIIMDGYGIAPTQPGNAIAAARTTNLTKLMNEYSWTQLAASGSVVGLPENQDGNSEAGHMNIGAGRIIPQEALMIDYQITSGMFFKNPAFKSAIAHAKKNHSKLHLMGMLANRMSAHAFPGHLEALLVLCQQEGIKAYLHLFTDGRDAPPHEAVNLLKRLQDHFLDGEVIATIMGRYYGMERNKRWEITEQAYNCLVLGEGEEAPSAEAAITRSYNRGETDEFIRPHVIDRAGLIDDSDAIIFFNLRSDRARQITKCFVQSDFNEHNPGAFQRRRLPHNIKFVSLTDFGPDLDSIISAFPAPDIPDTLPIALRSLRQLYIAESEKYAHVTYFLNGGYDHPVNGETWQKIPSPNNPNYALTPGMSAVAITDFMLARVQENAYDFYVLNFANADMLGHTGNFDATKTAIEIMDQQIGRLWAAFQAADPKSLLFISADHGNAEEMINLDTHEMDTEHSTNPVPFIITQRDVYLRSGGGLANIAPTVLKLLQLPPPAAMTEEALC